jgi:dipeptide/tripeptide permease
MAIGMTLTGLSFFVLYYAATLGESRVPTATELASGSFRVNERVINNLRADGIPENILQQLATAKDAEGKYIVLDKKFPYEKDVNGAKQKVTLTDALNQAIPGGQTAAYVDKIQQRSHLFRVSPFWLIFAYAIVTLGELMLSPMGLSLVSKVAPIRMRGLMMGGWFVATAIGNKLTQIGVFWSIWNQSTFFIVLGGMALFMAVVLFLLLKPLKKAMPGV